MLHFDVTYFHWKGGLSETAQKLVKIWAKHFILKFWSKILRIVSQVKTFEKFDTF